MALNRLKHALGHRLRQDAQQRRLPEHFSRHTLVEDTEGSHSAEGHVPFLHTRARWDGQAMANQTMLRLPKPLQGELPQLSELQGGHEGLNQSVRPPSPSKWKS